MTKPCREILEKLRILSGNTEQELILSDETNQIWLFGSSISYDYSKYKAEIHSIINQLAIDGYLIFTNEDNYIFTLTHKGLHPHRYHWESIKKFLLNSVLIPILVSITTTLLVTLIQSLLSLD